jgi:YggT family protein
MLSSKLEIINIVRLLFQAYEIMVILRVIMSWINMDRYSNSFCDFIYSVTDVIIKPFRAVIPLGGVGLDLSPILALVALGFIERIVLRIIISLL